MMFETLHSPQSLTYSVTAPYLTLPPSLASHPAPTLATSAITPSTAAPTDLEALYRSSSFPTRLKLANPPLVELTGLNQRQCNKVGRERGRERRLSARGLTLTERGFAPFLLIYPTPSRCDTIHRRRSCSTWSTPFSRFKTPPTGAAWSSRYGFLVPPSRLPFLPPLINSSLLFAHPPFLPPFLPPSLPQIHPKFGNGGKFMKRAAVEFRTSNKGRAAAHCILTRLSNSNVWTPSLPSLIPLLIPFISQDTSLTSVFIFFQPFLLPFLPPFLLEILHPIHDADAMRASYPRLYKKLHDD